MAEEKILEKLGKLKAHMESAQEIGNEQEAQAFAAMLQNLLAKHKLEMTDIQYTKHLQDEPVEETEFGGCVVTVVDPKTGKRKRVTEKYPDYEVKSKRCDWAEMLASVIARAHSCQTMCMTGSNRVWFVGRKTDTAVVDYLFVTMYRAALKISWREYCKFYYMCRDERGDVTLARGFRDSFLNGFVSRLAQRFEEEKRNIEAAWQTGTALIRISREALAVKEYLEKKGGKKAAGIGASAKFHAEGYRQGQAFANGLNLKANACNGGNSAQKHIGCAQ